MSKFSNFHDIPVVVLDELVELGDIELGRGNVISKIDIRANEGLFPIYSSSSKNNGMMGRYGKFMFDEELVTWSVDGGGTFFYRPKHKFSITNVSGYMRANQKKFDYNFLHSILEYQHQFLVFDYQNKAHPSVIRELYEIPIPPLPEQKKIASILNSVDDVIKITQKQIDKLLDLKKASINQLMMKGIGHTEFKDSELGRIPKSWKITTLGNIGDFTKGKGISKIETTLEGIPCIRYAEIYTEYNYVIDKFKSFILTETTNATKKLKTNDIIFAGSGETVDEIGKSVAFISNFDAYVGGDTIVFSPNIECNSVFLSYQLNDDSRRIQLRKFGQGSSVIHVYTSGIKQLKIGLPPIVEQNKITEILLSYSKTINAKRNKLTQTQSLKKSLMQDLLTGKIRVKVN